MEVSRASHYEHTDISLCRYYTELLSTCFQLSTLNVFLICMHDLKGRPECYEPLKKSENKGHLEPVCSLETPLTQPTCN